MMYTIMYSAPNWYIFKNHIEILKTSQEHICKYVLDYLNKKSTN